MSTAMDLIAVPELKDTSASGAIVFWRLAGGVDFDDLEAAWHAARLDAGLMPAPVSRMAALKRTMVALTEPGVMVRGLKTDEEGFVLVRERYDARGRPSYTNELEVTLAAGGALTMQPYNPDGAGQLATVFAQQLNTLTQQDVSGWLVDLVRGVQAVRLRDTGGIYFVPRPFLDTWRCYASVLRAVSECRLFEIPAMATAEASVAILDAVTREAEEAAAEITKAIDDAGDDLSSRARTFKLRRVKEVEAKLGAYEALLGVKLEALRESFGGLQARLCELSLAGDE